MPAGQCRGLTRQSLAAMSDGKMRMKLLVAAKDESYTGHLSGIISSHHSDVVDVAVCSTEERLKELLRLQKFDVALIDTELIESADLHNIRLPLMLWSEEESQARTGEVPGKIRKYRRVSVIVADILEQFAKVSASHHSSDSKRARVTAVWSPSGGVGKTTVALAYASKAAYEEKQALYLNLEPFSSTPAYFAQTGKSISSLFEMLETREGNVEMLVRSILCRDGSGLSWFCKPENFDDMNILSAENIAVLAEACAGVADELVVDLPCACDDRTRLMLELADKVFIVTDQTDTAQSKLSQFVSQHNVFECVKAKAALVVNRGAVVAAPPVDNVISLPLVQSADVSVIYKTLANCAF